MGECWVVNEELFWQKSPLYPPIYQTQGGPMVLTLIQVIFVWKCKADIKCIQICEKPHFAHLEPTKGLKRILVRALISIPHTLWHPSEYWSSASCKIVFFWSHILQKPFQLVNRFLHTSWSNHLPAQDLMISPSVPRSIIDSLYASPMLTCSWQAVSPLSLTPALQGRLGLLTMNRLERLH